MPFSVASASALPKAISPSFGRSSDPSSRSTPGPNASTSLARPGVPGSTTARAALSASRTTAPSAASRFETSLLPAPIPPVSPTRSILPPSLRSWLPCATGLIVTASPIRSEFPPRPNVLAQPPSTASTARLPPR